MVYFDRHFNIVVTNSLLKVNVTKVDVTKVNVTKINVTKVNVQANASYDIQYV